ncbi:MAG: phosphoheptose isomerase [Candidatus Diapherotrites archaeon]|nr:phosphoheptose isomerase [Candidatus Diapherotrites archaeon]
MTEAEKQSGYLKESLTENGKKSSPKLLPGLKNYLIDIDGVICEDIPNEEPERMPDAFEIPGSKEQINKWFEENHIITFFTARTEEHRRTTEKWLKERGFKYHCIVFGKPRGGNYHYIDDNHIQATRFVESFENIKEHTTKGFEDLK